MDRVEEDPAAERGPGAVRPAVVGAGAPEAEVVAERATHEADPPELGRAGRADPRIPRWNRRFIATPQTHRPSRGDSATRSASSTVAASGFSTSVGLPAAARRGPARRGASSGSPRPRRRSAIASSADSARPGRADRSRRPRVPASAFSACRRPAEPRPRTASFTPSSSTECRDAAGPLAVHDLLRGAAQRRRRSVSEARASTSQASDRGSRARRRRAPPARPPAGAGFDDQEEMVGVPAAAASSIVWPAPTTAMSAFSSTSASDSGASRTSTPSGGSPWAYGPRRQPRSHGEVRAARARG